MDTAHSARTSHGRHTMLIVQGDGVMQGGIWWHGAIALLYRA